MFERVLGTSMLWKAQKNGIVKYELIDLRDFGLGPRKTVDDTPYGGGAGMVLRVEPLAAAIDAAKLKTQNSKLTTILLTPGGKKFDQKKAHQLAKLDDIILVCGHYEGYDERVTKFVDEQISIGDYVLTGGEIPAMAVIDSVVRLIPGVLGDKNSPKDETFEDALLEYPQYTRPADFQGMKVPEVLQNGNHGEIAKWRKEQSLKKTKKNRPDLLVNK